MKSGTERQAVVALAARHNWKSEPSIGRTGGPMLAGGTRILSLTPARWASGRSPLPAVIWKTGMVALRTTATAVGGMSGRGAGTGMEGGTEVEVAVGNHGSHGSHGSRGSRGSHGSHGSHGSMATGLVIIEVVAHDGSGIVDDRLPYCILAAWMDNHTICAPFLWVDPHPAKRDLADAM